MKFAPSQHAGFKFDMYAVAGPYALVGFYNQNVGISALLMNKNGTWQLAIRTRGDITADEYEKFLPGIPQATARGLRNLGTAQDR